MKQIFIFLASTLIISFMVTSAYCQRKTGKETIYLINGSIIYGEIIEYLRYEHVKVQLVDDLEVIIPFEKLKKISSIKDIPEKKLMDHRGFASIFELGINVGRHSRGEGMMKTISIHVINGYQFSQYALVGLGVGYDKLQYNDVFPLYLSFRGDIRKQKISPTYQADFGYGFVRGQNSGEDLEGGIYFHPGLGYKFYLGNIALGFNAGYKIQKSKYSLIIPGYELIEKRTYNRFTVRTVIYF